MVNRMSVTKDAMGWCVTVPGTGQPYALISEVRLYDTGTVFEVARFDGRGKRAGNSYYFGFMTAMAHAQEYIQGITETNTTVVEKVSL